MGNNFETIKTHFVFSDQAKEILLKRWMAAEDVSHTLGKHNITTAFFGNYFGSKVIEYAFGVVEGRNKLGNCPVIGVMLVFFEKKNIPLEDVFTICVNLKNELLSYTLEKGILNSSLLREICTLIDHNFFGVIQEYLHIHYYETAEEKVCMIDSDHETSHIAAGPSDAYKPEGMTSAYTYMQEVELDLDIIHELGEIEEETLASLGMTDSISAEGKASVIDLFTRYAKMINLLVEFQELNYALWVLIDLLVHVDFNQMEEESTYIVIYIKAIISDLSVWRTSVFLTMKAEDIHYLDKTLLSSIAQLQILLSPQDADEVAEMEFF
ncbi:MAG: histidine kinase [Sulfuricurvum sp.]|nr:histidine kinase [Sulfuricurvum sp.]